MPKVVVTHSVAELDNWLKGKSERAEAIGGMGGANVVDHVAQDGSKEVAVTFDTDDVDVVMAALARAAPRTYGRHGAARIVPPLTAYIER
jgi:hypothetical protein